jgi:thymidylate synthase (FAD)
VDSSTKNKELFYMSNVDIKIFNIARTEVDREEVRRWLDHVGANGYEIPDEATASSPALLIALAAKRCYMSFEPGLNPNVTKVRRDMVAYFDNILLSRHGSVLEHAVYSFAIEGISRVFTAEMNRHRAGWAISEGSLRYIRFDKDIPWWLPTSLQPNEKDDPDLALRKARSVEIFRRAFGHQEECYAELLQVWDMDASHHNFHYKKVVTSCLRRIVGLGVATGGVWTGNMRALRHVIAMRATEAAEEEIFYVFDQIARMMVAKEPLIFNDFKTDENGFWTPEHWKV